MTKIKIVQFACGRYGVKDLSTNTYYGEDLDTWRYLSAVNKYCKYSNKVDAENLKERVILASQPVKVLDIDIKSPIKKEFKNYTLWEKLKFILNKGV